MLPSRVVPTLMYEREIYSDTFGHGLTAFELEPNGAAAGSVSRFGRGADCGDKNKTGEYLVYTFLSSGDGKDIPDSFCY